MQDDKLDALLRQLPASRASDGFTSGVMAKIARPAQRPRHRGLVAVAAAALIAIVSSAVVVQQREDERREALVAEQQELRRELEQLKAATPKVEAVVPIGSTDEADYLVDVGEVSAGRRGLSYAPHSAKETYEY